MSTSKVLTTAITPDLKETYQIWRGMFNRCYMPTNKSYKYYGGKGVRVCSRWHDFDNFLQDMGKRPLKHQLDRISSEGDYCQQNCRWVTAEENNPHNKNKEAIVGKQVDGLTIGMRVPQCKEAKKLGYDNSLDLEMYRYTCKCGNVYNIHFYDIRHKIYFPCFTCIVKEYHPAVFQNVEKRWNELFNNMFEVGEDGNRYWPGHRLKKHHWSWPEWVMFGCQWENRD